MAKLLKPANNISICLVLAMLLLLQFSSCKKVSQLSNHPTFLKTYDTDSSYPVPLLVEQLPDGSFIIASATGKSYPLLIKTDKAGNLIWKRIVPEKCMPLN